MGDKNPQPISHNSCQQLEENQVVDLVIVKDLDSGMYQSLDPNLALTTVHQIKKITKQSVWEKYWNQRDDLKKVLFRMVNQDLREDLQGILTDQPIDLQQYKYLDGWTLLHHATSMNRYNIVIILVMNGANIDGQTHSMKRTALHMAVLNNNEQIVQFLLQQNANPNIQDIDFCTPLHYVIEFCHIRIFKLLLKQKDLDFTIKNHKKMTPIDCCRDARLKILIEEYCGVKQSYSPSKIYTQRCVQVDNISVVTKTRADYVEFILGNKLTKTTNDSIFLENRDEDNRKAIKKNFSLVGGKMNTFKLNLINSFAKQSLVSYQQSLIECKMTESLEDYDIIKRIGSGSFGEVFSARKKQASKLYAIKRLTKKDIYKNKLKKYVQTERQILKQINHPFIVHGYSFFQDQWHLYMVIDFCACGDLQKMARQNKFSEPIVKLYCCQVILALEELHNRNYLFRDLKPANVLIDSQGHIKLTDFGLAKQAEVSYSFLGSVAYLAPQMLTDSDNKMHGPAIDWYLLGVFCYELLTGYPPFYCQNIVQMHSNIKNRSPKIPNNISVECKKFLSEILVKSPEKRLGFNGSNQLKQHSWFKEVDWVQVLNRNSQVPQPKINQKQLRRKSFIDLGSNSVEEKADFFPQWDYSSFD